MIVLFRRGGSSGTTAELTNSGSVQLTWTSSVAHTQYFSIWRKMEGESAFSQIGDVRGKRFFDESFPAGKA